MAMTVKRCLRKKKIQLKKKGLFRCFHLTWVLYSQKAIIKSKGYVKDISESMFTI